MSLILDTEAFAKDLPAHLARAAQGEELHITHGAETYIVSCQKKVNTDKFKADYEEYKRKFRSRGLPPITMDEILAWRDEGRK